MISTINEAALFLSRWTELSVLGKATILLALGLAVAWAARRTQASVRHLVLTGTFAALLALPLLIVAGPRVPMEVAVSRSAVLIAGVRSIPMSFALTPLPAGDGAPQPLESGRPLAASWPALIRFVWIAGAILLLARLAVNLWSLSRLRRNGLPWPERHSNMQSLADERGVRLPVEVLLHEDIPAPLTCGIWRPAIMLPTDARDWSEAELRCALVHELEHVRRGDWAIQLMARVVCGGHWFHPLVWAAWRRLSLEAERACDDAVIQTGERADYAEQLVSLARRMSKQQTQPALGMANRSDLARRVTAVLDSRQRRGRAGGLAAASALIGAALVVLAIAPVHAVAQSSGKSGLNQALYEAAESGELPDIEQLLNAGANVNCALSGDGSPLIAAARKGRLAPVRLLLDRGADPNMPVRGDGNPLIMAAREGRVEVVTLLLDRGASINQAVPDDENALIQASGKGRLDVVKLLVSRGADVNARIWVELVPNANSEWRSALSMARKGRHEAVVSYLISVGARE